MKGNGAIQTHPETHLSGKHITECVASLPEWLRAAALEAAVEARMFACVAERLAARFSELEECLEMALWDRGSATVDGGHLLLAVGAEIGLGTMDECLSGAADIIAGTIGCIPSYPEKGLKHVHEHRAENSEPLLLESLTDFYGKSRGDQN